MTNDKIMVRTLVIKAWSLDITTPVFADDVHELWAVLVELCLTDAGDREEGLVIGGQRRGHLSQGLVAEDDVRRDALIVGELFA